MSVPDQGWYLDPQDPTQLRWWDGEDWTDHTHEAPRTGDRKDGPRDPGPDHFAVPADDEEPLEELDLGDLQPDHVSPVIPAVERPAQTKVPGLPALPGQAAFRASLVSALAALGAGLGSAFVMGTALATSSVSRSATQTLVHAEQGIGITLVVVVVAAAVAAITCFYSLQWSLRRFAGVTVEPRTVRRPVGVSMGIALGVGILITLSGTSPFLGAMVGSFVILLAEVIQLRRGL